MKNCTYTLKVGKETKKFLSELELNNYIKNNISKFNVESSAIYSLSPKALQVVNKLNSLPIKEKGISVHKLIESEHMLRGVKKLLTPEYREKERKANTREQYKQKFSNLSEEQLTNQFETYYKELLHKEELNKNFGTYIHGLLEIGLTDGLYSGNFKTELNRLSNDEFKETLGTSDPNKAKDKIHKLVEQIALQINKIYGENGKVYVEFKLNGTDYLGQNITGRLDILAVHPSGKIDIIDLKLSENLLSEWDFAKRSHVNYQLMTYRQMLVQAGFQGKDINLYTIPLKYEIGNIDSLTEPTPETINLVNLSITDENFTDYNGEKNSHLKLILPATISEDSINISEVDDKINKILAKIFPKYSFKTKRLILDAEIIYNNAIKRKDENGFRFYNEKLGKDETGFKTEQDLKKRISEYVEEINNDKNSQIAKATKTLDDAIKTGNTTADLFKLPKNDGTVKSAHNTQFEKYLKPDSGWSLIESDVLLNAGMIGLEHTSGVVEFIIFTVNDLQKLQTSLPKSNTVLGMFYSENEISHNFRGKRILESTNGNIELIKALTVINNLPEFFTDGRKLGNIKVMNYLTGLIEEVNMVALMDNFAIISKELKDTNNFGDIIPVTNYIDIVEMTIAEIFTKTEDPKLKNIFIDDDNDEVKLNKIERLEKLRERMLDLYPHLSQRISKFTFKSQEERIFVLIAEGLVYYKNINFYNDYAVSKFGFSFSEVWDFVKSPFSYNITSIDKQGNRKIGFLGGTVLSSTDSLPSKDMLNIYQLFNFAMQEQRDLFEPQMVKITNETRKWQQKLGYSDLYNTVVSGTDKINRNLYRTNDKNELDPEFLFKNPFKDVMSNADSEYLKFMLWQINKWRVKGLSKEERNLNYTEAYKLDKVISAMNDSVFFEVPLEKGMAYTKMKGMTQSNITATINRQISDMKDWFDKREITDEQEIDLAKQTRNYNFMSNRFRMSSETRQKMLKNNPDNYWEINLDKLVLDFEKEYIQENAINKVLPTINSALLLLKFNAEQTGKDATAALDYFFDQIKSSIFNESIISKEFQDPLKVVEVGKKALSYSALALRPPLMIKETIVGLFGNVARAATGVYGENSFKIEHLTQAYKIMMGLNEKFTSKFNLCNAIDHIYAVSNMDINQIVERTRTDRAGITSGINKHLFFFSTQSDYWNRMTLFIAQMLKDGSWDAHSVTEEGGLIYDWSKDKRFDEYVKHKANPKYTSDNFLKQKALYYTYIKQLRAEGVSNKKGELINFGDDLPKAYTSKDRESLKSFADMAYGYYDHEKKSLINNMAFGSIFMQFMTYWTAKWKTWTIRPGTETMQGRQVEKTMLKDGVEIPVYLKEILDDEGNIIDVVETTETDGTLSRAMKWEGTYMEGLFWSLTNTMKDVFHGRFSDIVNDKLRLARVKLALHDLLQAFLGVFLAKLFFSTIKDEKGIDYTDDDHSMFESMLKDYDFAVSRAFGEFNPFTNTLGNLKVTPGFIDFWGKMSNDLIKVLSGDKEVESVARKYVKAMSLIPEID